MVTVLFFAGQVTDMMIATAVLDADILDAYHKGSGGFNA